LQETFFGGFQLKNLEEEDSPRNTTLILKYRWRATRDVGAILAVVCGLACISGLTMPSNQVDPKKRSWVVSK